MIFRDQGCTATLGPQECVLRQDNVSRARLVVPSFLVSELCPYE